ncbi:universal stress protein [Gloeobacter morelensis]|uniref:Universal stress protein n=1 Tax=Gloeobacter morelensis MG652769 TaxID=2781736 RepID=A0ABY3PQD0_9CYAN|nr:universal stress protein [Gloeobacter morelensis]UFP95744.1 universal stress protein [Gloeobacter morelensis MG652769]
MDETATAALLYRKILVPCVDLASATASITAAAALATVFDSEMLVLHVVHPKEYVDYAKEHIHDRVTPLPVNALQSFERKLAPVLERFAAAGAPARLYLETGDPGSKICEFAAAQGVDLLVMTRRSLGFWDRLMGGGSVTEYVLRHAPCSLLIAQ